MINDRIARRLPFRLVQRLSRHVHRRFGSANVSIPVWDPAALAWIYWQPDWLRDILGLWLRHHPGIFLDIGANVGQTLADYLAADVPSRYVGFEPNVRCVAFIQELIAASDLSNAEVLPIGLWHEPALTPLYLDSAGDQTASLRADLRPTWTRRREWISALPLDQVANTAGLTGVSLAKIDVEGAELEVLQGMVAVLRRDRPLLICEVLLRDPAANPSAYAERMRALRAFLRDQGYRSFRCVTNAHRFTGIQPVDEFPLDPWTAAGGEQCDYVFAPDDADLGLINRLASANS